jgi:hypothetical protein
MLTKKASLALSLNWDDQANARPCEDGEDPRIGKCNPNTSPERERTQDPYQDLPGASPPDFANLPAGRKQFDEFQQQRDAAKRGPQNDSEKALKRGQPVKPGLGLEPTPDPNREQRNAQHVQNLTKDTGKDHKKTAWAVGRMFGKQRPTPQKDGSLSGGIPARSEQEAKQLNDDSKVALQSSGWKNTSDVGTTSSWQKGSTVVTLTSGGRAGRFGNGYRVRSIAPSAKPKKRGWFS